MDAADFVNQESLTFQPGQLVVVSGQDSTAVYNLLMDARTAMETAGKMAVVYDSHSTVPYLERLWVKSGTEQARLWEYMKVLAANEFTILVSNQYDPLDKRENSMFFPPSPGAIILDLFFDYNVRNSVQSADSRRYGGVRELYPFINKIYYYDMTSGQVTLIKNQCPDPPA